MRRFRREAKAPQRKRGVGLATSGTGGLHAVGLVVEVEGKFFGGVGGGAHDFEDGEAGGSLAPASECAEGAAAGVGVGLARISCAPTRSRPSESGAIPSGHGIC